VYLVEANSNDFDEYGDEDVMVGGGEGYIDDEEFLQMME
jgi:hypothetical protein